MSRLFIIAEAGVNHNGDPDLALRLVDAAAEAGADAVKFQTFRAESLAGRGAAKAAYQTAGAGADEGQLAMLKRLELDEKAHERLMERCRKMGILFCSTPFDRESMEFLFRSGMPFFKVPSGELTNPLHLRALARYGLPLYLSTGMATLGEVEFALDTLEKAGLPREKVTLLHCTTEYPAPLDEVNLKAMNAMRAAFPGIAGVGYSDHTRGIEVSLAAVALGADVLEKHFTLDRSLPGPDHAASLEPAELAELVRQARNVERALGSGRKSPGSAERRNMGAARRSLVAARAIAPGEPLGDQNMTVKRPGTGLSPMLWDTLQGVAAPRAFAEDECITLTPEGAP